MIGAIILGIVAGYLGRFLMPGKDPMGFFATILLGLAGALLGYLIFSVLLNIGDDDAFDLGGLRRRDHRRADPARPATAGGWAARSRRRRHPAA